jgi:Pyridoxal-dependent decarboxylase conserved domain
MGIGTDNVYLIETDEVGKMIISHLGKFVLPVFDIKFTHFGFRVSQKVKFCAPRAKAPCRSWSRQLQVMSKQVSHSRSLLNECNLIGTTVLGAFDPLEKIADLCEKHKMWMHVDAAWGGKNCRKNFAIVRLLIPQKYFVIYQAAP